MRGSSPRGRGKPTDEISRGIVHGLIPARAGKTGFLRPGHRRQRAHPRAGGENRVVNHVTTWQIGSSPRGRGKPKTVKVTVLEPRLIPARAGKTRPTSHPAAKTAAHPRAGGENASQVRIICVGAGSSPRGRGKRQVERRHEGVAGLIPARAGKTDMLMRYLGRQRAHPRAGGENAISIGAGIAFVGSSPRGRGKPYGLPARDRRRRLIPARAGKTAIKRSRSAMRAAHPRAGGENSSSASPRTKKSGSSPRGRGKLRRHPRRKDQARLIPARAGKTGRRG